MKTSAGDFDYDKHGQGYAQQRRTDPRIAAIVHQALGSARTVLNIGAGAGSYEPEDRYVLAIEPSAAMRAQRPAHLTPAIMESPKICRSMISRLMRRWLRSPCINGLTSKKDWANYAGSRVIESSCSPLMVTYWIVIGSF